MLGKPRRVDVTPKWTGWPVSTAPHWATMTCCVRILALAAHVTHLITHRVALYSRHLGDDTISRTKTTLTNPTKTNSLVCGEGQPSTESGKGVGRRKVWERGRPSPGVQGSGKARDLSTTSHPPRSARRVASQAKHPQVRRPACGMRSLLPHATAPGTQTHKASRGPTSEQTAPSRFTEHLF